MAVLTSNELTEIRQFCTKVPVRWSKAQLNSAAQAVENELTGLAAGISAAIDAAVLPFVFTNAEKKLIAAKVFEHKFKRDG